MNNFDIAESSLETSIDSANSAMEEHEKWLESIEAKLQQLEAAWQTLSNTAINSDLLKGGIDTLTSFVNVLTEIVDKVGVVGTAIAGVGIGTVIKDIASAYKEASKVESFNKTLTSSSKILNVIDRAFPNLSKGITEVTTALGNNSGGLAGASEVAKSAMSGLWTVISNHPMIAVAAAIGATIVVFDALTETAQEANEAMEESADAYSDAQSEVESINSELDSTKASMDELNAKDSLTFVEKEQLEDLKEATEQLRIQADLAERAEDEAAEQLAKDTEKAYKKSHIDGVDRESVEESKNSYHGQNDEWTYLLNGTVSDVVAGYEQIEKAKEEALSVDDLNKYNELTDLQGEFEDSLWDTVEILQTYKENLEAVPYDSLTDSQKQMLDEISESIETIYMSLDPGAWQDIQFSSIFDDFSGVENELLDLTDATKNVGITVDDVINKYPELAQAIQDAGFEVQDLVDYINSEAGILNLDNVGSQLKENFASYVDAVADSSNLFDADRRANKKSEFNEWIDSLSDEDLMAVYKVSLEADTSEWDLDDWKDSINNAVEEAESEIEPITLASLFTDEEGNSTDFASSVGDFQDVVDTINDALESLKSGDEVDLTSLYEQFGSFAVGTNSLEEALTNLSIDKLKDFSEVWKEATSSLSGDELQAANDMFASIIESIDLSGYDFSNVKGQILDNIFSSRDFSTNEYGSISRTISEVMEQFAGDEDAMEIIYKLSLNPDSANWTLEEWIAQVEDMEVSVKLTANEENIAQLTNELSDIETEISKKEKELELKEARGETVTESDYRTLIRGEQEEIQKYEQLIKETKAEQESLLSQEGMTVDSDAYRELNDQISEYESNIIDAQIAIEEYGEAVEGIKPIESLDDFLNNDTYSETLSDYATKLDTLQTALDNIASGDFSSSDIYDLESEFSELVGHTDSTEELSAAIEDLMSNMIGLSDDASDAETVMGMFNKAVEEVGGETTEAGQQILALRDDFLALYEVAEEGFSFDVTAEIGNLDDFYTAFSESLSGTGLSTESLNNIKSMYSDLEGYDASALFEKTANGIQLNSTELRKLQAEYEATKKADLQEELESLSEQYKTTAQQLALLEEGTDEYNATAATLSGLESQITEVTELAIQYDGLTSAYNKWVNAQSASDYGDMYDSIRNALEETEEAYNKGLTGTEAFRSYVDLLSGADLSTASGDEVVAAYEQLGKTIEGTSYTALSFLEEDENGVLNFLNASQELNDEWVHMNEDDSWTLNFDDQELADSLGIDVEFLESILDKLKAYNFDIDFDSAYASIDDLKAEVEDTESALKELGLEPVDIDVNTDDVDSEIEKALETIDEINNSDVDPEVKTAQLDDANAKLDLLVKRKLEAAEPTFMSIDSSQLDADMQETYNLLVDYQNAVDSLTTLELTGADTSAIEEAQTKVDTLAEEIASLDGETKVSIGLDADASAEDIKTAIENDEIEIEVPVSGDTEQLTTDAETAKDEVESTEADMPIGANTQKLWNSISAARNLIENVTSKVPIDANTSLLSQSITNALSGTRTISVVANVVGTASAVAAGTAHANGTAYGNWKNVSAYAGGTSQNWALPQNETALVNEVGTESFVRDGTLHIVSGGAHLQNFKRGDIIFNAKQTEELQKYGKVLSNGGHGRIALAEGTAFGALHAYTTGSGTIKNGSSVKVASVSSSGSSGSSGSSKSSSSSSASDDADETLEKIDWIEVAIDRAERSINHLKTLADSVYQSFTSRNKNLSSEIDEVTAEIELQEKAYTRYIKEANSVGLSSNLKKKVQDGTININEYDEDTQALIEEYQKW